MARQTAAAKPKETVEKLGLHHLTPAPGSTKNRKRLGRGPGSGTGKTSGKGHKGIKARAGHHGPGGGKPHFEGGQMPITRRLPKRGFTNPFKETSQIVRLDDLAKLGASEVTRESLAEAGLIRGSSAKGKVLANGAITQAVTVRGLQVSAGAREKIVAAGGRVEEESEASMAQNNAATAVQNLFRTPELKDKILFTLLCLLVYRIGAHVTAPGVNPIAIQDFINSQKNGGGLLGLYNLFTGGQLSRATVFALGIMPYISASIFQQIAQAVVPQVDKMSKDEEGRKRLNQWSRYATVALAAVQAWGFAIFSEGI